MQREMNIKRNNAVLQAMGIIPCAQRLVVHTMKPRKAMRQAKSEAPCEASRISNRLAFRAKQPVGPDAASSTNTVLSTSLGKHRHSHAWWTVVQSAKLSNWQSLHEMCCGLDAPHE